MYNAQYFHRQKPGAVTSADLSADLIRAYSLGVNAVTIAGFRGDASTDVPYDNGNEVVGDCMPVFS